MAPDISKRTILPRAYETMKPSSVTEVSSPESGSDDVKTCATSTLDALADHESEPCDALEHSAAASKYLHNEDYDGAMRSWGWMIPALSAKEQSRHRHHGTRRLCRWPRVEAFLISIWVNPSMTLSVIAHRHSPPPTNDAPFPLATSGSVFDLDESVRGSIRKSPPPRNDVPLPLNTSGSSEQERSSSLNLCKFSDTIAGVRSQPSPETI